MIRSVCAVWIVVGMALLELPRFLSEIVPLYVHRLVGHVDQCCSDMLARARLIVPPHGPYRFADLIFRQIGTLIAAHSCDQSQDHRSRKRALVVAGWRVRPHAGLIFDVHPLASNYRHD
ncbi:hypothetical protein SAMN03159340_00653 [Sphingomonas sp. NFR15]|nr:hypothetical protein SAMN03159340_00653 [Sphingomonas sp. NFR15]